MTRLDCNVEKCAYNADNCCKLREIDVKGTIRQRKPAIHSVAAFQTRPVTVRYLQS